MNDEYFKDKEDRETVKCLREKHNLVACDLCINFISRLDSTLPKCREFNFDLTLRNIPRICYAFENQEKERIKILNEELQKNLKEFDLCFCERCYGFEFISKDEENRECPNCDK